jgi:hypothetical protein
MQLCYLLTGLEASILLAMGGWDKDQTNMYWAERFMCQPPASFVHLLMPWLQPLQTAVEKADAAGEAVHFSARGILRLLPLLAYVVVQDALELCADGRPEEYRNNPVHRLLLAQPLFRYGKQQTKLTAATTGAAVRECVLKQQPRGLPANLSLNTPCSHAALLAVCLLAVRLLAVCLLAVCMQGYAAGVRCQQAAGRVQLQQASDAG